MRKDITVVAAERPGRGKNEARRLRARGLCPAVLYGAGKDSVAVTVSPKEIQKILHSSTGHNTIFNLSVEAGETAPVMIIDWQRDPVKGQLLHTDLKRIDLTRRITVKVPVHTHGDPVGVKVQGGLYELVTREIEIECLPDDIPEHFDINVQQLGLGQSVRAGEIGMTGSMKLVSPPEAVISHVIAPKGEVEKTEESVATAEPEVIKKGKKEEEAGDKKKK